MIKLNGNFIKKNKISIQNNNDIQITGKLVGGGRKTKIRGDPKGSNANTNELISTKVDTFA